MGLSLSSEHFAATHEEVYQNVEERASGLADIGEVLKYFIFASVGVFFHIINNKRASFTWMRAWPLLVLLLLAVLSVLWSEIPGVTLRRLIKHLMLMVIVAGVVIGAGSPREILRLAVLVTGLMMVLNFASVLVLPSVAFDGNGLLQGLHGHKNQAGIFAMITISVWLSAARYSSGFWTRSILYCGTLFWFLFLLGTYSRTSILCLFASILFIIPLQYCIKRPTFGVIVATLTLFISLCVIFILVVLNISFSDVVDFIEGERTTLTGRSLVWRIAYNAFLEHQLLGTGFRSLWSTGGLPPVEQYTDLRPTPFLLGLTQAHSGYLDILATLGIVGAIALSVFLISIIATSIRALKWTDKGADVLQLAELSAFIFFASLIYNLAQSAFLTSNILWVLIVLCYLLLCSIGSPTDSESTTDTQSATTAMPRPRH